MRLLVAIVVYLTAVFAATFLLALGLTSVAGATVPASEGNLLISCALTHTASDDPIKFPGIPGGSAHEHDFFGVLGIDAFTTTASLLDHPHSCNFASENIATWVPSMVWADGTEHAATQLTVYYRKPLNSTRPIYPIPVGFRTIEGNPSNTTQAGRAANWMCGNGAAQATIPSAACTSGVQAVMFVANCWNGNDLDNAAHDTLVGCTGPGGSPGPGQIELPAIQVNATYPPGSGGGKLESDIDAGTANGYTFHWDYWFAGDPYAWAKVDERCLNAGIQCRVVGKFTQWPEGSIVNTSVNPFQVVLTAAEAKGLNP